jgi:L-asparaginase II
MDALSVAVRRGGTVESRHRFHAVAVQNGATVAAVGDPQLATFLRSAAKPLQALPLARDYLDLADDELAIACASHQAEPPQLEAVRKLLERAGAGEEQLECGPQPERGEQRIRHNCSGKHAGFLAVCRARGWPAAGYRLAEHPLQQALLEEVAHAAQLDPADLPTAVDGCGVLTFALPVERMAIAFSRIEQLSQGTRAADAMRARPELVGGEGADDTALMTALPGWLAKRGAEGLLCALAPDGIGVAAKVEDGTPRALRPALAAFLAPLGHQLGDDFARVTIRNSRGEEVGEVTVE